MSTRELFLINSIYRATEGEGVFIGSPQIFVRYQGCHIGCVNCDSKDTWEFDSAREMKWEEIVAAIDDIRSDYPIKRLSITGGDPLHPKFESGVIRLAEYYGTQGFFVNIEASGMRLSADVFKNVDYISFDYKTPSTQVRGKWELVVELALKFPGKFQIKSVVQDLRDFDDVWKAYQNVRRQLGQKINEFTWAITPAFNPGEELPHHRFLEIMDANDHLGGPFRVIGQQHKFIFGPDKKNV